MDAIQSPQRPVPGAPARPAAAARRRSDPGADAGAGASVARPKEATLRNLLLASALLAEAHAMQDAVDAIRPVLLGLGLDGARLHTAIALVKLRRGDVAGCLSLLQDEVLRCDPGNDMALALQAWAWRLQGLASGPALAGALLATSTHPFARSVARAQL